MCFPILASFTSPESSVICGCGFFVLRYLNAETVHVDILYFKIAFSNLKSSVNNLLDDLLLFHVFSAFMSIKSLLAFLPKLWPNMLMTPRVPWRKSILLNSKIINLYTLISIFLIPLAKNGPFPFISTPLFIHHLVLMEHFSKSMKGIHCWFRTQKKSKHIYH